MRIWYNRFDEVERHVLETQKDRVRIGRSSDNDLVLSSHFVAPQAAVLERRDGQWVVGALGLNGCEVDGKELRPGQKMRVLDGQTIKLHPFTVNLDFEELPQSGAGTQRRGLDRQMSDFLLEVHRSLLGRMSFERFTARSEEQDKQLMVLERNVEEIATQQGLWREDHAQLVEHIGGQSVRSELLNRLIQRCDTATITAWVTDRHWSRLMTILPDREKELDSYVRFVAEKLKSAKPQDVSAAIEAVERGFWTVWDEISGRVHLDLRRYVVLRYLKMQIKDIVFGYGPLEDLLRIPSISEIMVVDRDHVYVEKKGVLENTGRQFISDAVTQAIIERIVANVGRRIDKSQPMVDARLSDGSRVNAVIPPIAIKGPCLTVRKFPLKRLVIDDLVESGSLTRSAATFLRACVLTRRNILVSGGTGTGKTTLLNCLSNFIPDKERIITIEDTAELQLAKEHVVQMETKLANAEEAGEFTIRDLVRNALRMRPDRIIVGECRGPEALDMLQAMNTGHDGSMTTLHANNTQDTILRLEVLVQMAADLPILSIHRQIASAIDLVVQLRRCRTGRRVAQITEIVGLDHAQQGIVTRDLFLLEEDEVDAKLSPTGFMPSFMGELIEAGLIELDTFYL